MSDIVCILTKNSREKIVFRVGEFKGHKFVDLRIFVAGENGNGDTPTKKGLAVPLHLYREFREALMQVEEVIVERGLLDLEDLKPEVGTKSN
jgi:hypothetical protein